MNWFIWAGVTGVWLATVYLGWLLGKEGEKLRITGHFGDYLREKERRFPEHVPFSDYTEKIWRDVPHKWRRTR